MRKPWLALRYFAGKRHKSDQWRIIWGEIRSWLVEVVDVCTRFGILDKCRAQAFTTPWGMRSGSFGADTISQAKTAVMNCKLILIQNR